ncbi:type VII secretion protein EccC [Actinoallomurus bryophytorum]|uniref:S-DNA-T family DNA segregation ATPase FtsK/SpoIIIE n=1 Tax=Actinoallomurus bryophytorum TaxID=1490222 RepID=A0A543CUY7_9ACTN|nr:type VII secretion protein EccCa [Actinoallomurus bryophytorum]TQM00913.1 S-DNA-T family DNA segregation ATPase FtsK/SpoIIIE [Actinoallomurus bryophytorum]
MSRIAFHRPARTMPPAVPEQRVTLAAAPQAPQNNNASTWLFILLPLLSSVSMAAYMVTYGKPWLVVLGISFVVVSVGVTVAVRWQLRSTNRRTRERLRDRFNEHLADIRRQARGVANMQRVASAFAHPSPERLLAIAAGRRRVWERRPTDDDFLKLRLGVGYGPHALQIKESGRSDPMAEYDKQSQRAAQEVVAANETVGGQPAWLDLGRSGVVSLLGPAEQTRAAARALLSQLAALHAPDDVAVAVCANGAPDWEWAKWLPHTHDREARGAEAGVVPLVAAELDGLADYLEDQLTQAQQERAERATRMGVLRDTGPRCRLVVVLDGYRPDADWARTPLVARLLSEAGPDTGVVVVCLVGREKEEPGRVDVRARVDESGGLVLTSRNPSLHSIIEDATADRADQVLCAQIARFLAPLRLSGERDQVLSRTVSLPEMLGVADLATYDPRTRWQAPDDDALLRMPIGVTGDGEYLNLDLKESAQGGIGPHGLVVGATGSGKSELLRTLVTGLTMRHSPELLSFVLVDFKGGATFAGVTDLPHVAGLITNLADDLALVDRMRAALHGEQQRRQRILRDAGNVDSLRDYQIRQAAGGTDVHGRPLEPLPYLLIVVDEFGELLSQRPDFIDLFVQIGRVGRSLGMHLLLATQRLEEGRLRGLESHLSYRICLRTFSAAESRAVIGTPDAYRLPSIPGSAYLKVDESLYERFRVAHVSAPYREPDEEEVSATPWLPPVPFTFRTPYQGRDESTADQSEPLAPRAAAGERTEMHVAVDQVRRYGSSVHQVWLPPLPEHITLDAIFGTADAEGSTRGLQATNWPQGQLSFPIGVVDLPARQTQYPLILELAGAHGHLALVGAPQTGKSTALRTALIAAMLTHTPDELQFYCVDHGGGGLQSLQDAPHVRGVTGRHDEERTRRALSEVHQLVGARERLFEQLGISSANDLRRLRDEGGLPTGISTADVVLAIDNWAAVRAADESFDALVVDISSRGLGVGVHLILTANRWPEIRTNLRDNIRGRIELRLNEPAESEVNRQAAKLLRTVTPGRGITAPGLIYHAALPRMDGVPATDNLGKAQEALVVEIAASWPGEHAPRLRILPKEVTLADLQAAARAAASGGAGHEPTPGGVPIGLREVDLAPVELDLSAGEPHFLVFGDSGAGKTSFLRAWMRGLIERKSAYDVRFIVVDYRRGLLDAVPDPYVGGRAGDVEYASVYVEQLVGKLKERLPPPDVSLQDLRERSWWTGPEIYLVVDDYDLVCGTASRGPLAPLADYLTQARDVGFHLVLARRVGGSSRSLMSDPLISRLRELGAPGLVMSGDHREGVLLGDQRAVQRPPGRAALVRRDRPAQVIQTVLDEDR